MAFIDWLRKQHEESTRNRALFEDRPRVAASQAWGGYQDSPGGQRLMVRQMQRPEVTNKLVSKNDGTQTLTKTWKDPDASVLKATGLGPGPETHPVNLQPWPVRRAYWGDRSGLRDMAMSQEEGLFRNEGALSPEAQAAIAQVQATRGQNVDAYGNPLGVDVSNQRAMYHALRRPKPQVVPPMQSIMNTGSWSDNLGNRYLNWRQKMIEADRRRRQRGNY